MRKFKCPKCFEIIPCTGSKQCDFVERCPACGKLVRIWKPLPPEGRMWRTLVWISRLAGGEWYAILPGWDSRQEVRIPLETVPDEIRGRFTVGFRCHAQVNIGAEKDEDLHFSDWEMS